MSNELVGIFEEHFYCHNCKNIYSHICFISQLASKSPGFGNNAASPSLFPVSATPVSSPNPLATLSPQATPNPQASPLTTSSPMTVLNAQVEHFKYLIRKYHAFMTFHNTIYLHKPKGQWQQKTFMSHLKERLKLSLKSIIITSAGIVTYFAGYNEQISGLKYILARRIWNCLLPPAIV